MKLIKRLLAGGLTVLTCLGAAIEWPWDEGVDSWAVTVWSFTNNVVLGSETVNIPIIGIVASTGLVYKIEAVGMASGTVVTNHVQYFVLDRVFPDCTNQVYCRGDRFASTLLTTNKPYWNFAHIPCRQHRTK